MPEYDYYPNLTIDEVSRLIVHLIDTMCEHASKASQKYQNNSDFDCEKFVGEMWHSLNNLSMMLTTIEVKKDKDQDDE